MGKKLLRVEIDWVDSGEAAANDEWTKTDKIKQRAPNLVKHWPSTTGKLLHFDDHVAVVGLTYDEENDTWFSVQIIQRSAIRKVTILRARNEVPPEMFDKVLKT